MPDVRILYIEDDPDVAEIARLSLRLHGGFAVEIVRTGEAALALMASRACFPTAILLDLRLAQESGLDILRTLKADAALAAIPVIMMTAGTRDRSLEHCLAMGAIGIIAKPFDPFTLGRQILDLLATAGDGQP